MRNLVVVLVMTLSSMINVLASSPSLSNEIHDKVSLDLSNIELDKYAEDYVFVSFKIQDGQIMINNIKGSQTELKKLIVKELVQMEIESEYDENKLYQYRFTFEKI